MVHNLARSESCLHTYLHISEGPDLCLTLRPWAAASFITIVPLTHEGKEVDAAKTATTVGPVLLTYAYPIIKIPSTKEILPLTKQQQKNLYVDRQ